MSIMEVHRGGSSEYRANVYSITVLVLVMQESMRIMQVHSAPSTSPFLCHFCSDVGVHEDHASVHRRHPIVSNPFPIFPSSGLWTCLLL